MLRFTQRYTYRKQLSGALENKNRKHRGVMSLHSTVPISFLIVTLLMDLATGNGENPGQWGSDYNNVRT